jgi:hypothetical protein
MNMTDRSKKKPQIQEELSADIESHPDRGKIDGEPVIRLDRTEFRGSVPRELYKQALLIGGSMGLSKSDILVVALTKFVSDSGHQAVKEATLQQKSEKFGISVLDVIAKIFGVYKALGREKRARLAATDEDE